MQTLELKTIPHNTKIGDKCGDMPPNITESTIFTLDGVPVGFLLKEMPDRLIKLINVANAEFLTDRVPKTEMSRGPQGNKAAKAKREAEGKVLVTQYSTILGSSAPKPHMRIPYPRISPVHEVKTAKTFVKAMLLACTEAEQVIKELTPNIYEAQEKIINEKVPPRFRFGKLFTSSISNFNIWNK